MERSYNQSVFYCAFNNGFGPGIMLSNWAANERATYALWAGPNQSNPYGYHVGNSAFAFTGRFTYLPIYDGGGRYLLHLGTSVSTRSPDQGQFIARATGNILSGPPGPLNPVYATTGSMTASNQSLVNLEMASVWGPLTVQSEYCVEWVANASPNLNLLFTPAQQAFVGPGRNGDHPGLVHRGPVVHDRREPGLRSPRWRIRSSRAFYNFYWLRGANGCPCFGTRGLADGCPLQRLDLNTAGINGGTLNSITLGLNWYLTPNMKFQWNYDFTHRSQVPRSAPATSTASACGWRWTSDATTSSVAADFRTTTGREH